MDSFDRFETIRPLWKHQTKALKLASGKRDFALFFEPGCGKTLTAIAISRFKMFMQRRSMRTLVVCPPIVIKNWKKEWLEASRFNESEVVCLLGSGKQRAKAVRDNPLAKVFVMNFESLLMKDVVKEIVSWQPEILIIDESHRCKSHSARRTKEAIKLSRSSK